MSDTEHHDSQHEPEASGSANATAASDHPITQLEQLDFEAYHHISEEETKKRRRWLFLLLLLLLLLVAICGLFYRYITRPVPLPELIAPQANLNYPPHYLFSIFEVDKPVGVAVSPSGDRIYVAESGGERLVQIFDRDGSPLGSMSPPDTNAGERAPVYLAIDRSGRVYVTDRMQHAIYLYDRDGRFLDAILAPDLTLSEYIAQQSGGPVKGAAMAYNLFRSLVSYQPAGDADKTLPLPEVEGWAPLGVRFSANDTLYLTDVTKERNRVWVFALGDMAAISSWSSFNPPAIDFGASGQENGQFLFPNSAVVDSQDHIYVSDGNNGRITVWDQAGNFLFSFGSGTGDGSLNLPRGLFIDTKDRLHVVDAVGQKVHVYDVSGPEPAFLYSFGEFGVDDGLFNYPNDIAIDASGRLYVADRENNRVQVWSY